MNNVVIIGCLVCRDVGETSEGVCKRCCEHTEHDLFMCLACGFEQAPGDIFNEDEHER